MQSIIIGWGRGGSGERGLCSAVGSVPLPAQGSLWGIGVWWGHRSFGMRAGRSRGLGWKAEHAGNLLRILQK